VYIKAMEEKAGREVYLLFFGKKEGI